MKKSCIALLFFLSLFKISFAQLSGIYTIGGISPDYVTIHDAISALDSNGVSAPVVFNIRNGIYYEGLIVNTIAGASATNTITFESESNDSTAVELNFTTTSTQQYGIYFNQVSYVRLHQLSIIQPGSIYNTNHAIIFVNHGNYLSITNSIISGDNSGTSLHTEHIIRGCSDTGMVIRNCVLSGGNYGVYLSSIGTFAFNSIVDGNHFFNISENMLSLDLCSNTIISNNTLDAINTIVVRGILVETCNETTIFNNTITLLNGQQYSCGLQISSSIGTVNNHSKVYNNVISVTAAPFGSIITHAVRCDGIRNYDFCFNNISLYGDNSTTNGFAMYIAGYNFVNDSLIILNNIITRFDTNSTAATLFTDMTGPNVRSDYNLIYSAHGKITLAYTSFAQYQAASLRDSNSISVDPLYVSISDLHANATPINNGATPVSYISTDISGNLRNSIHPTIGAYEVLTAPIAINPLQNISTCENETVKLPANFYGASPLTYQWYKNGNILLNDTLPAFNFISVQLVDSGTYQCIATNNLGSDTAVFIIHVNALPNVGVTQNNDTLTAILGNASYQWIDCNNKNPVPNDTNPIFIPAINGNYAVVVSQNGCSDTSNCFNVIVNGFESNIQPFIPGIFIYPNPSKGILIVHCTTCNVKNTTISILDVLGHEVYNSAFNSPGTINNECSFNIQHLSQGIYFVKIDNVVWKFVKE